MGIILDPGHVCECLDGHAILTAREGEVITILGLIILEPLDCLLHLISAVDIKLLKHRQCLPTS